MVPLGKGQRSILLGSRQTRTVDRALAVHGWVKLTPARLPLSSVQLRTLEHYFLTIAKGAIGFDGDDKLVAAYRGAQAHVKTRAMIDCER